MFNTQKKQNTVIFTLSLVAVALLWVIFYSPVWWVALKAPQYPEAAFPNGIRINFAANGVFNGCEKIESTEKSETEALNCKHEMDAINHYVGMYPIAGGAPVERAISFPVFMLFTFMILAFALTKRQHRAILLACASLGIAIFSYQMLYSSGGASMQSSPYLNDVQGTMHLDDDEIAAFSGKQLLEESYREALTRYFPTPEVNCQAFVPLLKYMDLYASQKRQFFDLNDILSNGGVSTTVLMDFFKEEYQYIRKNEVTLEAFEKRFQQNCNNHTKIYGTTDNRRVEIMLTALDVVSVTYLFVALMLVIGVLKTRIFNWLLILIPFALPIFFIIDYAGWLWWFGHNLSVMGAFTVKPFMPTVFGVGKVAQFSTYSYPYYGFAMMVLMSIVTGAMALIRFKQHQNAD
ncbi:MAG: hypothetical protein GY808_17060 [Gammaproteobacteria bacterium]|nr:hypothetical protein [Gammaproteobacteria bacterium]